MRYRILNGFVQAKNVHKVIALLEAGAKVEVVADDKPRSRTVYSETECGRICLGFLHTNGGAATKTQLMAELEGKGKTGSSYSATMSGLIKEGLCSKVANGDFRLA